MGSRLNRAQAAPALTTASSRRLSSRLRPDSSTPCPRFAPQAPEPFSFFRFRGCSNNDTLKTRLSAYPLIRVSAEQVAQASETLQSALKRAAKLTATAGLAREASEAQKARRRAAQQLNELTQTLAVPLGVYTRGFPKPSRLHPFERALLDLTVGTAHYERTLLRVDVLRKATLECGKGHCAFANKANTVGEAELRRAAGFKDMEALFEKGSKAVDDLKEIAKTLRALPVAELDSPTVTLVGAPNVGKSSLVRLFSSGRPEVQNYPFTTRGIHMGHILVDEKRFVLTDTPGVLPRPDGMRNRMERLTLATLAYLPVRVLFVLDLSGGCGTKARDWVG